MNKNKRWKASPCSPSLFILHPSSFILLVSGPQFIGMRHRRAQAGDLLLVLDDQLLELGHFLGVLALLVLAETKQVSLVLRPPAVEILAVLLDDGRPQP